jgi:hypothetical protein
MLAEGRIIRLTLVTYLFQIFGGVNIEEGIHGRVKGFKLDRFHFPDPDPLKKISNFVVFFANKVFDMIYTSSGIKGMDRVVPILK